MNKKEGFRDLKIWQRAIDISVEIYKISSSFPDEEKFGLTSQIRKAANSISANIAEGWGRGTQPQFANFLRISRGSLCEVDSFLELSVRLGFTETRRIEMIFARTDELGKMLASFLKKVESNFVRETIARYDEVANSVWTELEK